MSEIDDGGPAFPHMMTEGHKDYTRGLSVRDWFAGQVLAALTVNGTDAVAAYAAADAMIAARSAAKAEGRS